MSQPDTALPRHRTDRDRRTRGVFSGRLPIGYPPRDESLERIGAAIDHADRDRGACGRRAPRRRARWFDVPARDADTRAAARDGGASPRPSDRQAAARKLTGTDLEQWLRDRDINHVTIVGYMTNVCCDTTARQALHMGMGTWDPPRRGRCAAHARGGWRRRRSRDTATRHALAPLGLIGVDMMTTNEWMAGERMADE